MDPLDFLMRNERRGDPERARGNLAPYTTELSGLQPIEGFDATRDVVKEVDQMPATSHGYDEKEIAKGFAFGPGYDGGGEFPEPDIEGITSEDINEAAYEEGLLGEEMGAIPYMPLGSKAKKALGVKKTATTKKKQTKKHKKASFGKKKSKAKSKAKAKAKAKAKKSLTKAQKNLEKAFKEYNRVMKM